MTIRIYEAERPRDNYDHPEPENVLICPECSEHNHTDCLVCCDCGADIDHVEPTSPYA